MRACIPIDNVLDRHPRPHLAALAFLRRLCSTFCIVEIEEDSVFVLAALGLAVSCRMSYGTRPSLM